MGLGEGDEGPVPMVHDLRIAGSRRPYLSCSARLLPIPGVPHGWQGPSPGAKNPMHAANIASHTQQQQHAQEWARTAAEAALLRTRARSPTPPRQAPGVGLVEAVVQRLDALLALAPAELVGVCSLEEAGRQLHQPLGVDLANLGSGEGGAHVWVGVFFWGGEGGSHKGSKAAAGRASSRQPAGRTGGGRAGEQAGHTTAAAPPPHPPTHPPTHTHTYTRTSRMYSLVVRISSW